MFDIAFDEGNAGIFDLTQRDEFRAEVEPDRVVSLPVQQIGEHTGTAAEIGDPRPWLPFGEPRTGADQPQIALRRKNVIAVCGGVTVEERDFFLLVLLLILGGCDHSDA